LIVVFLPLPLVIVHDCPDAMIPTWSFNALEPLPKILVVVLLKDTDFGQYIPVLGPT